MGMALSYSTVIFKSVTGVTKVGMMCLLVMCSDGCGIGRDLVKDFTSHQLIMVMCLSVWN